MSKWKEQIAVGAGTAQLFGRIIVADDADLFGSDLEPGSVFLAIIMNHAIAIR